MYILPIFDSSSGDRDGSAGGGISSGWSVLKIDSNKETNPKKTILDEKLKSFANSQHRASGANVQEHIEIETKNFV